MAIPRYQCSKLNNSGNSTLQKNNSHLDKEGKEGEEAECQGEKEVKEELTNINSIEFALVKSVPRLTLGLKRVQNQHYFISGLSATSS